MSTACFGGHHQMSVPGAGYTGGGVVYQGMGWVYQGNWTFQGHATLPLVYPLVYIPHTHPW